MASYCMHYIRIASLLQSHLYEEDIPQIKVSSHHMLCINFFSLNTYYKLFDCISFLCSIYQFVQTTSKFLQSVFLKTQFMLKRSCQVLNPQTSKKENLKAWCSANCANQPFANIQCQNWVVLDVVLKTSFILVVCLPTNCTLSLLKGLVDSVLSTLSRFLLTVSNWQICATGKNRL